jgi:hypothetical protein
MASNRASLFICALLFICTFLLAHRFGGSLFPPGVVVVVGGGGTPLRRPRARRQPAAPPSYSCAHWQSRGLGEFSLLDVSAALPSLGAPAFFHDRVDPSCPKFVQNDVNGMAGLGHRALNMLAALHAALHYNVTYAHTFSWGDGVHGAYRGWDALAGLDRFGHFFNQVGARRGVREVRLPGPRGADPSATRNFALYDEQWGPIVRDPKACNVVYRLPGDVWPYDVTTTTKPLLAHYFAAAGAAAGGAGPPGAARATQWDPSAVNVVVHVRKGDVTSMPEDVMARVVSETVLPALRRAGLGARAAVHVFAEFRGYTAAAFPALAALAHEGGPGAVNVTFWEGATEWDAFLHMTAADFLVISQSGFPKFASLLSLAPLTLSFPSSDHVKHAHADTAPCYYDGRCSFTARTRVRAAAERLRSGEACGLLDRRGTRGSEPW